MWKNLLSNAKLIGIVLAVWTPIVVGTTLYTHNKFIDAAKLSDTEAQLDKAKEAPGKIIKFNQQLRKTGIEKDTCYNAAIPAAALDLLRQ